MEKTLEELKNVEVELNKALYDLKRCIPLGQYIYIENKVKEGKAISKEDLQKYAERYAVNMQVDILQDKYKKLKQEFVDKKNEFFEYLKNF